MPDFPWRVAGEFDSSNRHFIATDALVDPDGFELVDDAGEPVLGYAGTLVQPEEIEGAKPFDSLVLGGQIALNYFDLTAIIASGSSLSAAIPLDRRPVLRILIPSGWTTASITFLGSYNGADYFDITDEAGDEVELAAAASKMLQIANPDNWGGIPYLKIRSGTSGTPVTQAADRTITLSVRDA